MNESQRASHPARARDIDYFERLAATRSMRVRNADASRATVHLLQRGDLHLEQRSVLVGWRHLEDIFGAISGLEAKVVVVLSVEPLCLAAQPKHRGGDALGVCRRDEHF